MVVAVMMRLAGHCAGAIADEGRWGKGCQRKSSTFQLSRTLGSWLSSRCRQAPRHLSRALESSCRRLTQSSARAPLQRPATALDLASRSFIDANGRRTSLTKEGLEYRLAGVDQILGFGSRATKCMGTTVAPDRQIRLDHLDRRQRLCVRQILIPRFLSERFRCATFKGDEELTGGSMIVVVSPEMRDVEFYPLSNFAERHIHDPTDTSQCLLWISLGAGFSRRQLKRVIGEDNALTRRPIWKQPTKRPPTLRQGALQLKEPLAVMGQQHDLPVRERLSQ